MGEQHKNYYEILEIPVTASPKEIMQGYQRAKTAYSPDNAAMYSLLSNTDCEEMLEQIEEANSILSDQGKRKEYDKAKGITGGYDFETKEVPPPEVQMTEAKTPQTSINQIVAKKKYRLEFELDPDFEQRIEQATEFTGEFLRNIREYKNVSLERLSEMTKVSKTYLACIEEEKFDKLPATVYIRGFIYQYAKCLKLSPDLVATSYIFRLKKLKDGAIDG